MLTSALVSKSLVSTQLHEARLDKLAKVAVHAGLALAHGQELLITAPLEAFPLVRRVTECAYKAGASLVTTLFLDDEATLARFRFAPDETFDCASVWLEDGITAAYRSGVACLGIVGADPALLAKQDAAKVGRAALAAARARQTAMGLISRHQTNWSVIACATASWANLVFPTDAPDVALAKLWNAIFAASRIDVDDPVGGWKNHGTHLSNRAALLNAKRFDKLHFKSDATDLEIGLYEGHVWLGGNTLAANAIHCLPNLPTEEVFTTPHKEKTSGVVASTKPLSYQGSLIQDIRVRFDEGRVTEATARVGESTLHKMLSADHGAAQVGEVALVPHSSPISASGLLFWNTLLDENAASHIALGQAYSSCLQGGPLMTSEELGACGANASLIHVDWMIGSGEMNVDGIRRGQCEPLMRNGEWV